MKTKIYYDRDCIGRFTCDGRRLTKFQAFKESVAKQIKRIVIVMFSLSVIGWSVYCGSNYIPRTIYAQTIVNKEVPVLQSPVLDRISKCESNGSQYDKNGQVLIKTNTNGTVDVGKFQINSVWEKQATKLGYDLTKEADNEAMAQFIYLNYGTDSWSASMKCWK